MIEEIMKLRKEGLSFRKIADELNTTVGKVQYQWRKYQKNEQAKIAAPRKQPKLFMKTALQTRYLNKDKLWFEEKEHLTLWRLSENILFVFWRLYDLKKDLVSSYFDTPFNSFQKVLRIYDVTNLLFNGSNAHQTQEVRLSEGQTVSLLKKLRLNRCYIVELGILVSGHKFFPLLRSNPIHIPKGSGNQGQLENQSNRKETDSFPEWIEQVSTYSYYESILNKDDKS